MWNEVAPAFEAVTGLAEPKRLNMLRVEAKTLAPAMTIQKNW